MLSLKPLYIPIMQIMAASAALAPGTALAAADLAKSKAASAETAADSAHLFDQVMQAAKAGYHDPKLRGLAWDDLVANGRRALGAEPDRERLSLVTNGVLAQLAPSAPLFVTEDDQLFWALRGVASGKLDGARLRHIGAWFERRGKRWFVRDVMLGSPAAKAGLMRGDEIVSADGKPLAPVASFRRAEPTSPVMLEVRRVTGEAPKTLPVMTVEESLHVSLERSMRRAYRVITVPTGPLAGARREQGVKVAYLPLPSATHAEFRSAFAELLARAESEANALVLDLRGNFGALDLTYDDLLLAPPPPARSTAAFTKPLVVLVDQQTTTGKEWLAWMIQRQGRGRLVGERTAGRWRAGKLLDFEADRAMLYLSHAGGPSAKLAVADGEGVRPDIAVDQSLVYAAGADAALKAALEAASALR